VQGSKSIAQRRVISSRQLLEAVAYASLGRLPNKLRVLAHRTLPPWELTGQSSPRTEVPYCRIPYAPVVGGVEDNDPSLVEHFEKIGVDLGEMGSIRKALCTVTVDSSSTRLYAARGLQQRSKKRFPYWINHRYLYEIYRRGLPCRLRVEDDKVSRDRKISCPLDGRYTIRVTE
jgi:hypothetical protein